MNQEQWDAHLTVLEKQAEEVLAILQQHQEQVRKTIRVLRYALFLVGVTLVLMLLQIIEFFL